MATFTFNRKTTLGVACVGALVAGMLLPGSGPSDATASTSCMQTTLSCPVQVQVVGAMLKPGVTCDQVLDITVQWSSARSNVHVERATGVLSISALPGATCSFDTSVRDLAPGAMTTATVQVPWDEYDENLRKLRRTPTAAQAQFTADTSRTVRVAPGTSCATAGAATTAQCDVAGVRTSIE